MEPLTGIKPVTYPYQGLMLSLHHRGVEPVDGVEPSFPPYKRVVLPLDDTGLVVSGRIELPSERFKASDPLPFRRRHYYIISPSYYLNLLVVSYILSLLLCDN